ncbi:MAG: acetyl-CoA synthase subunit gamma, partial [Chloroflexi bacterium RBG_13_46_14]
ISHRQVIIPQLGAPGVSAHELKRRTHFNVIYGPVHARDIPEFLDVGMKATPEMRVVNFGIGDRLVLAPMEIIMWGRYGLGIALALFFLTGFSRAGYALPGMAGGRETLLFVIVFIAGSTLVPLLLPWLPGRALSVKGMMLGFFCAVALALAGFIPTAGTAGILGTAAWVLMMPAVTSFLAMNFTGATTYTSLSGVKKEMRFAIPLQIVAGAIGLALWITARFF